MRIQPVIRPGRPDDDNRHYLPEELYHSDITVNENGNNSLPYPERLQEFHEDLTGEGKTDTWYEYVPESYDPARKSPLVISLHGGLMTGWGQCCYNSWPLVADREGLICAFPTASEMRFWTIEGIFESGGPTELDGMVVPRPPKDYRRNYDMNLILALIRRMKEKYNIDEERIFMQGMSMGNLMTAQFSRYYGNLLAGAAGAAAATWPNALFDENGEILNVGGPVPVWQARPEHNDFGGDYEGESFRFKMNRYYWMKINECSPVPQIRIEGEDNFAFYKGAKADLVFHDIRNRDHGQKLDEAFLYWDYFFSGLRRKTDGTTECAETRLPRTRDSFQAAFVSGAPKALLNGEIVPLSQAPMTWQKIKYHGLNGGHKVRGEYIMVPAAFLARLVGGEYRPSEDGLSAEIFLKDGRRLQFARGSIGCMIDETMRQMYVETLHRNGELLLSAEWFCRHLFNYTVCVHNGACYVTDHHAELSYFMADLLKDLLTDRYSPEQTYEEICEKVSFIHRKG